MRSSFLELNKILCSSSRINSRIHLLIGQRSHSVHELLLGNRAIIVCVELCAHLVPDSLIHMAVGLLPLSLCCAEELLNALGRDDALFVGQLTESHLKALSRELHAFVHGCSDELGV